MLRIELECCLIDVLKVFLMLRFEGVIYEGVCNTVGLEDVWVEIAIKCIR